MIVLALVAALSAPSQKFDRAAIRTTSYRVNQLVEHARSWDDLAAAWKLDRGLWAQRDLWSRTVALRGTRKINEAARKLAPPMPLWFHEVLDIDARGLILDAHIALAESFRKENVPPAGAGALRRLFLTASDAWARDYEQAMRATVPKFAASRRCVFGANEFDVTLKRSLSKWNMSRFRPARIEPVWRDVARFTLEREETVKMLELKSGIAPKSTSQCSDGSWSVDNGVLRFRKKG